MATPAAGATVALLSEEMRPTESEIFIPALSPGRHIRLHGPGSVADQTNTGPNQYSADRTAQASGRRLLQEHDSLFQGMSRTPVTAERQSIVRDLCPQHRCGIRLARVGVISHDGRIASELLVEST
jgi:hypothetical protein